MEPAAEAACVARLRAGDPAGFDAAFAAWRPRVYGFLVRMTRRRDLAEDLLQETFLRLARHARELRPDTRLGPWLFTVARNAWLSHGRRLGLEGDGLEQLVADASDAAPSVTPIDDLEAREAARRLEAAIAALPPAHREVLLLVAGERLEPAQVAKILDLTPEAVRQRLARARAQLADSLAEEAAPARRRRSAR